MRTTRSLLLLPLAALMGCTDHTLTTDVGPGAASDLRFANGLDELKTVTYDGASLTLWPFTGRAPSLLAPADPMNLLFIGDNDPRAIRAALLFAAGSRPGLPFDCTWSDAIGDVQTAFTESGGWTANAIQLQCGDYGPLRFHLRLWDVGDWSLGGAHLEVLIPGTTEHEILNWELPELLVANDLGAVGVLQNLAVSGPIFPSPYRALRRAVYDGLPVPLQQLIAGWPGIVPPVGDVPLLTDERATILDLAGTVAADQGVARQRLNIQFDQVIPTPFCDSTLVQVKGPVRLDQTVVFTKSGNFVSHFHALGHFDVAPIDPQTGALGEPFRALVNQHAKGVITDAITLVTSFQIFAELPKPGREQLMVNLRVGPHGALAYDFAAICN